MDALRAAVDAPGAGIEGLTRVYVRFFGYELSRAEDELLIRYRAGDTGDEFWERVAATGLGISSRDLPALTAKSKGLVGRSGYVAIENTVARSPLILAAPLQSVTTGKPASAAQVYLTAFWGACLAAQRPRDGWIRATLSATAEFLGHATRGGWEYDAIRGLIVSMHGCVVPESWVTNDGEQRTHRFGVVIDSDVPDNGDRDGAYWVHLGESYCMRLYRGNFTYLETARIRRARQAFPRNEVAQRMFADMETQELPFLPGWPVFRVPEGEVAKPENRKRPKAEVYGLYGKRHKRVVATMRAAARLIMAEFPEYAISVKSDTVPTMYRLFAIKSVAPKALLAAPVDNSNTAVYEEGTTGDSAVYEEGTGRCMQRGPRQARIEPTKVLRSKSSRTKNSAEIALFDSFWAIYRRHEQEDSARRAFARLSDHDQENVIRAAGHYATAKADAAPRYWHLAHNFIGKQFREWQDSDPNISGPDDAGLLACHLCDAVLGPEEQADEEATTHDGHGWRHNACSTLRPVQRYLVAGITDSLWQPGLAPLAEMADLHDWRSFALDEPRPTIKQIAAWSEDDEAAALAAYRAGQP